VAKYKEASSAAKKRSDAARESSDQHSLELTKMHWLAEHATENLKARRAERQKRENSKKH